MDEGTNHFEGELDKYSGVGVFKHKTKIWLILDEFTITLCKFDKRSSCIGSINVYDIQIARKTGHKSGQEFEINTNTKCFTFIASSNELATKWVKLIQKAMSKRITPSSTVIDPERGRNRREAANPVPDLPDYDKANKFGVTLKPSSRIINKSSNTASSHPASVKNKSDFNRQISLPAQTDKKTAIFSPMSNRAEAKLNQHKSANLNESIKLEHDSLSQCFQPPPPCSPVREEKLFCYLNPVAGKDEDRPDGETATEIPKEDHDISKNFENESINERKKINRDNETRHVEQPAATTDKDDSSELSLKESEPSKKEEISDDISKVEMRKSRIEEPSGSPVVMRKSSRSQNVNSHQICQSNINVKGDSLYDDIAYAPVYPAQDSSDEENTEINDAVVDAFNDVFEDREESEPHPKAKYDSHQADDADTTLSAFTRLKEYLENNCEFQLDTHTVSLVKPVEMLRNFSIK